MNEVEGAGNTPMHAAAYEGWIEGAELLLSLGAKINASNNAGDRPYHLASYMNHHEFMEFLEKVPTARGPTCGLGGILGDCADVSLMICSRKSESSCRTVEARSTGVFLCKTMCPKSL